MTKPDCHEQVPQAEPLEAQASCCHVQPAAKEPVTVPSRGLWTDGVVWRRASKNTLVCLMGCSIGDVGTIVVAQAYWPAASMLHVMLIAIVAGLGTSLLLESVLLRWREGMTWARALRTAASMSLLSMIAMETAMNLVDYALTGGNRMMAGPGWYAAALLVGSIAGFVTPLPYNYWMLKKHGRACH